MKKTLLTLSIIALTIYSSASLAEKIVIFGATGSIGQSIVKEALSRGHEVVGVSRSPEKFSYKEKNFTGVKGNPTDKNSVLAVTKDADAIISAVGGREATDPAKTPTNLTALAFASAFNELGSEGPQIVVIGGGMTMLGSEQAIIEKLPPNAKPGSGMYALFLGHWVAYQTYLESTINWTLLAPPLDIRGFRGGNDVRSGKYRVAVSTPVVNEAGKSTVSKSDLAVAAVDFAENGYFNQLKVTVGD